MKQADIRILKQMEISTYILFAFYTFLLLIVPFLELLYCQYMLILKCLTGSNSVYKYVLVINLVYIKENF